MRLGGVKDPRTREQEGRERDSGRARLVGEEVELGARARHAEQQELRALLERHVEHRAHLREVLRLGEQREALQEVEAQPGCVGRARRGPAGEALERELPPHGVGPGEDLRRGDGGEAEEGELAGGVGPDAAGDGADGEGLRGGAAVHGHEDDEGGLVGDLEGVVVEVAHGAGPGEARAGLQDGVDNRLDIPGGEARSVGGLGAHRHAEAADAMKMGESGRFSD